MEQNPEKKSSFFDGLKSFAKKTVEGAKKAVDDTKLKFDLDAAFKKESIKYTRSSKDLINIDPTVFGIMDPVESKMTIRAYEKLGAGEIIQNETGMYKVESISEEKFTKTFKINDKEETMECKTVTLKKI